MAYADVSSQACTWPEGYASEQAGCFSQLCVGHARSRLAAPKLSRLSLSIYGKERIVQALVWLSAVALRHDNETVFRCSRRKQGDICWGGQQTTDVKSR
jgi:hypothetical protein